MFIFLQVQLDMKCNECLLSNRKMQIFRKLLLWKNNIANAHAQRLEKSENTKTITAVTGTCKVNMYCHQCLYSDFFLYKHSFSFSLILLLKFILIVGNTFSTCISICCFAFMIVCPPVSTIHASVININFWTRIDVFKLKM